MDEQPKRPTNGGTDGEDSDIYDELNKTIAEQKKQIGMLTNDPAELDLRVANMCYHLIEIRLQIAEMAKDTVAVLLTSTQPKERDCAHRLAEALTSAATEASPQTDQLLVAIREAATLLYRLGTPEALACYEKLGRHISGLRVG
ncbi:MAG: hypothetical protein WAO35_24055 [Terriglobia bacterium]